jgi:hypothetical protein
MNDHPNSRRERWLLLMMTMMMMLLMMRLNALVFVDYLWLMQKMMMMGEE